MNTEQMYAPPGTSPLPPDYDEFIASLNDVEKELHQMAKEYSGLGSSYFPQWTHSYRKWKATKSK